MPTRKTARACSGCKLFVGAFMPNKGNGCPDCKTDAITIKDFPRTEVRFTVQAALGAKSHKRQSPNSRRTNTGTTKAGNRAKSARRRSDAQDDAPAHLKTHQLDRPW